MKALNEVNGIGPKGIKLFEKMGIFSSSNLLHYYPFRYDVLIRSDVDNLIDDNIIIDGVIENIPSVFYFNKKMNKMTFRLNTGTHLLNVTIFNRAFLKTYLKVGSAVTVIGKYDVKHNSVTASEIKFGALSNEPKIEPVYHLTHGITSKQINNFISEIIDDADYISYVPDYLCEQYKFISKKDSLYNIHFPKDDKLLKQSINYLKYEELFMFMLKMNHLKSNIKLNDGLSREVNFNLIKEFIDKLPFELTVDQMKSVDDIYNDLISKKRMNRLLQGDVGSGKTIVAFISIYINWLSGYSSALMAPTEILANQHMINIKKVFKDYNINIEILTGKLKVKEKKEIYKRLKEGSIDVIVGTHALFQDDVEYKNLGLVITDEQHRFGVNQRSNLKNKGITPDILYMSATPIPRTYALTIYGDMDISFIKTMPSGRKDIITYYKDENEIKDILVLMLGELKNGHQAYVIAPLIEESDKIDTTNIYELEEKMLKAFGKYFKIGVLHGKMTSAEKDEVMEQFKNNKIQILISTTVIEVGVDVKNATMMVIFDSYRFGLSALHQLRGRVGRGDLQSYCVLVSNRESERLSILTKTNDGFLISEEDFKLRGSGDLFGNRQSGDMVFKLADFKQDFQILLKAKIDSKEFLNSSKFNNKEYEHIISVIQLSSNLD